MNITTYATELELANAATAEIVEAVRRNPKTVLGLSTGNSPIRVYEMLIQDHKTNGTSYKDVITFNLDEYVGLDGGSEQSYRYFMDKFLFKHIDIEPTNTHVPSGLGNLAENCESYEQLIKAVGGIDIQLIGIGTNGHIAFNEPGTPFDSKTHIAALSIETIAANSKYFESEEAIPKQAVSMGIQSIMDAKRIIMVAFGKSKAKPIAGMVNGPVTTALPASILQKHPNVSILLDKEAASLL